MLVGEANLIHEDNDHETNHLASTMCIPCMTTLEVSRLRTKREDGLLKLCSRLVVTLGQRAFFTVRYAETEKSRKFFIGVRPFLEITMKY